MDLARCAFALGYLPAVCALPHDGEAILGQTLLCAEGELRRRAQSVLATWPARHAATAPDLQRLEKLITEGELGQPPDGRDPASFFAWARELAALVDERARQLAGPGASDAARLQGYRIACRYRLGAAVGDALHTLGLGVLTHHLLDTGADNAYLRAQANALGQAQAGALARLVKLFNDLARLEQRADVLGQTLLLLTKAPAIGGDANDDPGEHRRRATSLQAVARAIDVAALEAEAGQLLRSLE